VVSPFGNLRKLNTNAQLQTFPYPTASKSFLYSQRLHGEIWRTISDIQKRDRQTDKTRNSIPHFDQISVKISVLGVLYPYRCTDGGEIWHGGGEPKVPSSMPRRGDQRSPPPRQISPPSMQCVTPAGDKPQNRPMSKLNTDALHCAQCCR